MRQCFLLAALLASACGARAEQPARAVGPTIVWHQLGSWSGHGNRQTESFASESGTLRVRWQATDFPSPSASRRAAAFRLTAHSAISGRPLQQVVDQIGPGAGLDYVQQDPHVFYMSVESSDVNWTFMIEE